MLIVKNPNKDIDRLIKEYEESNGLKLPISLKNFLKKYNGGETPKTFIKTKGISSDIRVFYGLGNVSYNFSKNRCIEKGDKLLLPFAEDSFGNFWAVDVGECGKVYFINHEQENLVILVDESFTEFINKCKSEKISEASKRTPEERERILIEKGKGANISDGLREMWRTEYEKYKNFQQEEVVI